jgi:DNA topoisomerase-1
MVIKFGRNGEFLACSKYPECKNTKEFERGSDGQIKIVSVQTDSGEKCEKCGAAMVFKVGKFGRFLACSAYPNCENTRAISLGVDCPDCGKPLAARRSRKGRTFYGCTGYPACKFASWDKPVNIVCPVCGSKFLLEKVTKTRGTTHKCPNKECAYEPVVK